MYEYIAGKIDEINPTTLILEASGVGYRLHISLSTFTAFQSKKEAKVFVYQVVREDSNEMYGFATKTERILFKLLLSVSGVGAATAQMMLSAMGERDIQLAIGRGDAAALQMIKGIGAKTAQRIVIDLKDKIDYEESAETISLVGINAESKAVKEEAVAALVMLGFKKNMVEKTVMKVLKTEESEMSVEQLIKLSLKQL